MTAQKDNRFYREAEGVDREARIEDDGSHIYWFDPVEGCWVAFRRVDCVGEEELPEQRISGVPSWGTRRTCRVVV